jgi:hypothetical protein
MTISSSTNVLIDNLLDATYGETGNIRQRFVFREALLGLVRVAKAEQVLEMKTTVRKLINGTSSVSDRQRLKSRQRSGMQSGRWPQQMEFNQFD